MWYNSMIKFDVPYNFDTDLISLFSKDDVNNVNCFFFPPPAKNYESVCRTRNQYMKNFMDMKEFIKHVEIINSFKENGSKLLLQRPDILVSKDDIKMYIDSGIKRFCVGNINQAISIKEIDSNLEVTASILMQADDCFIRTHSIIKDCIDIIVLPFFYCNNLDSVKYITEEFPNFKYTLLCNSQCGRNCKGLLHWLLPYDYSGNTNILCPDDRFSNNTLMDPCILGNYSKYIDSFKLIDRSMPSRDIYYQFMLYARKII